jgi:hypothetical protein
LRKGETDQIVGELGQTPDETVEAVFARKLKQIIFDKLEG